MKYPLEFKTLARNFAKNDYTPQQISDWFLFHKNVKIPRTTIKEWTGREPKQELLEEMNKLANVEQPAIQEPAPKGPYLDDTGPAVTGGSFSVGKRIIVIGDMQVKPGIDLGYCRRVGQYCADKKPDIIVNIGDFADMPSCSFHSEPGSKTYSAQNYKADVESVHAGMRALMEPIRDAMCSGWAPRLVLTLGNHEDRINRVLEAIPKLDGSIGLPDLEYERWGWEVHKFLSPVVIEGVIFSHYFCTGQMGRAASSASAVLRKTHMSSVCGHMQGRDMAMGKRGDGKAMTAIICGSTYEHDEDYLNPQTNNHWRGLYVLNDVIDGEFEEVAVSMKYLRRKYG